MARLFSTGFEMNTLTGNVEFKSTGGTSPTLSSTTVRSGIRALRVNPTAQISTVFLTYSEAATEQDVYFRFYLRIATSLGATVTIMETTDNGKGKSPRVGIKMTSANVLQLWNLEDSVQVGSDSSALSANTWYRVEVRMNSSTLASTAVEARIDGVSFASGTINIVDSSQVMKIGTVASGTCDIFFDDIAINNSSGSDQNSWPGEGKIIHLRPNAAGDAAAWTRGGSDSGANWSQVDENPPNDVTDYNSSTTLDQEDFFNCDACGLTDETISLVAIGIRFASTSASSNPTFKAECKKTSGGTIAQGSDITPNTTVYRTNVPGGGSTIPTLTRYQDPDGAAWTPTTLDSMQIGYKLTADNTNTIRISAVWALVEYAPAVPPPAPSTDTPLPIGGGVSYGGGAMTF